MENLVGKLHKQARDWLDARKKIRAGYVDALAGKSPTSNSQIDNQLVVNNRFAAIEPTPYAGETGKPVWPSTDLIDQMLLDEAKKSQDPEASDRKSMELLVPLQRQRAVLASFGRMLLDRKMRRVHKLGHLRNQWLQETAAQTDTEQLVQNIRIGQSA